MCFLTVSIVKSGDSRLWRHVLDCSLAKKSRFCSVELSMCLQNLSPQYANSCSYWNVVFL